MPRAPDCVRQVGRRQRDMRPRDCFADPSKDWTIAQENHPQIATCLGAIYIDISIADTGNVSRL